jgi:two-component system, cell cycle sensor histidine kinase and response regulator CckA
LEDVKGESLLHFIEDLNTQEPNSFRQDFGRISVENVRISLKTRSGIGLAVMLSSSLLTDAGGELAGTVTVAKDIRALDYAEQALRASEKRYRELVENINDVIFTMNLEGIITFVSPRVRALTDYSPEELIGRHIETVVPEDERPKVIERLASVVKGDFGASNYRLLKKDGSFIRVRISSRPILHEGHTVGIQGVLADITPLVQAMEEKLELEAKLSQARKMEAIGTLAGGVAHDLNNILSGISSYPEFLLMTLPKDSKLRKPLELIKGSGIKAAAIVQDLLTLARRGVAHFEVLNLNQVIRDYLSSPEYDKQRSFFPGASVEAELAPDLFNIKGSHVHLAKSVMNLLTNAFEALFEEGRIIITTRNRHLNKETAQKYGVLSGNYVLLSVEDNGVGIAPEDLDRIFEPFYTKKVMGRSGTGLGMAVVWGTVRDHKGLIDVQSKKGSGTCFDLYFPVSEETVDQKAGPLPEETYQGAGETILVVDDVAEQRTIASAMLAKLGYQVHTAVSGEEALAWVQAQSVDLVVLDMIMDPGMDGLETIQKILAIHPDQKVIIASGYSETNRVRQALKRGALKYLKKPYTVEEIGITVRTALGAR